MPGGYSKVLSVVESAKTSQNWPFVEWVYFRQSTNRELNFRQAFPPIVERRQNRRQKSPEFRNHLRVGHVRIIWSKVMPDDLSWIDYPILGLTGLNSIMNYLKSSWLVSPQETIWNEFWNARQELVKLLDGSYDHVTGVWSRDWQTVGISTLGHQNGWTVPKLHSQRKSNKWPSQDFPFFKIISQILLTILYRYIIVLVL